LVRSTKIFFRLREEGKERVRWKRKRERKRGREGKRERERAKKRVRKRVREGFLKLSAH